jgi:hypothetical protein
MEGNPFFVKPVSVLDALAYGIKGFDQASKTAKANKLEQARQNALLKMRAGDTQGAFAETLGVGDTDAAKALATYSESQSNRAFRESEAQRAQQNADRSFGQQENQIQFQQEQGSRPDIREVTDANGNKSLVLVDRKDPNKVTPVSVPGNADRNNPFLAGGNMNEGQSNAALYATRAMEAEKVLSQAGVSGAGGDLTERGRAAVPLVGNFLASENYQKFDQARRDFTAAILRKESGAAIGKEEYANADRQYFPQPGDSPAVIEQKRQNRISAIRGIGAAAGTGYRPATTIDERGRVVPRGGEAPQAPQGNAMPPPPAGFTLVQ